jgi:hypothetical protein
MYRNIWERSGSSSISHHSCGSVDSVMLKSKGAIDFGFTVTSDKAVEGSLHEFLRFTTARAPIRDVCDSKLQQNACQPRGGLIRSERRMMNRGPLQARNFERAARCDQPGGTRPAGALVVADLRPYAFRSNALARIWQDCWVSGHVFNLRTISLVLPLRPSTTRESFARSSALVIPLCRWVPS